MLRFALATAVQLGAEVRCTLSVQEKIFVEVSAAPCGQWPVGQADLRHSTFPNVKIFQLGPAIWIGMEQRRPIGADIKSALDGTI